MPNAGGALDLRFGKVPPKFFMSSFRACTTTLYTNLVLTQYAYVRIRLLGIAIIVLRFYTSALMIMGLDYGKSGSSSWGPKNSFVSFLKELGNKQNATLQSYAM